MLTKVVQALIRRGITTQTSSVVFAHEIPILKVARGAGNVEMDATDCSDYALQPTVVRPRDELIRLKKKYKGFVIDGQHPVDVAFPDGSRDLELFYKDPSAFDMTGNEEFEDAFADAPAELVHDEEGNPIEVGPSLGEPEVATGPDLNDRPTVIKLLNDIGVPFAATTPTKHLATLLTKSLEAGAVE